MNTRQISWIACVVLLAPGVATADVLLVPAQYDTIQDAVDAAQTGDIVLVADGTYTGSDNRNIDLLGKAITVRSAFGPDQCIIDCQHAGRGFCFQHDESVETVVDGFTITNGDASAWPDDGGGAICFYAGSSPRIANCIIIDNTADMFGGGLACWNAAPLITGCTIKENIAGHGAGVYCSQSDPTISDCNFLANSAEWSWLAAGGGGLATDDGDPLIIDCTFQDNRADLYGGGISASGGSPMIINCLIGNSDGGVYGGGMAGSWGEALIANCLFESNTSVYGAGLWSDAFAPDVVNCTFCANTANTGAGIYNDNESDTIVANCIVWGNDPDALVNVGSQLVVSYSDVEGGYAGEGNIDLDPLCVDPAAGDYRLASGSPCIDAGDNAAVPLGIIVDLAGVWRFVDDPDTPDTGAGVPPLVDMGAYEYQVPTPCPEDINNDGAVDVLDLLAVIAAWGNPGGAEDINNDGIVDVLDLLAVIAAWGPCV